MSRGQVAALAQSCLQEPADVLPLGFAHFLERQTLPGEAVGRDEVPVRPLVRFERERRFLALFGRQAGQK